MKRKLAWILAASMMFSLSACGGGEEAPAVTEMSLETVYSVEEYIDFTLKKISTTDLIAAPLGNGGGYTNDSEGETYIDVLFEVTNTSAETINSDDLMVFTAKNAEDAIYSGDLYAVETDNSTYVSSWEDINPKETVRFHAAVSVPKDEADLALNFSVNGEQFTIPYFTGDIVRNAEELDVDSVIESEDYATLTFKGIEYTDDVLPSDISSWYNHYEIDNPSNTYLVVKYDIMNLQSTAKKAETFVGVNAIYMNKYNYDGFLVVEETDRTGFNSDWEEIAPLTERHFYHLIEVPKSVIENPVELTIYFDGEEYIYAD